MTERSRQAAAECQEPAANLPLADVAALVVGHHAAVYRYAVRLCGCPTEAEDLCQQTFLIAQQKLPQLREPQRACAWLLAIVRNCFLKSRRKSRPLPAENIGLDVDQIAGPAPASDEIDREQLAAALADLPAEFRTVVLMFYFEDLSYHQIAEQLEIPIGTVMSRLSRGKGHLHQRLTPAGTERAIPAPHLVPATRAANGRGVTHPPGVRAAP
jgi:RNA polymerase sigma-70 factor (ECF subfamily)